MVIPVELNQTFDQQASQYERSRPTYGKGVIEEILRFKELNQASTILEIGCGTGQATELFIALNSQIHCIDPGENLVMIAQSKFSRHPNVKFIIGPYESYQSLEKYDLIFSATAYHWIRQPEGDLKTKELLKPDGLFAVFRNIHTNKGDGYFKNSQTIYRKYLPEKVASDELNGLMNSRSFEVIHKAEFPWEKIYDVDAYLNLISTYSDHIRLEECKRDDLFNELRELINTSYGGTVRKTYSTVLEIGKPWNRD